jgi:hypothetical protein
MSQITTFKIRDHITTGKEDSKGYVRAQCPSCILQPSTKGKDKGKNTNLSVSPEGAYKCHAGCSTDDIRNAIGQPKERQTYAAPSIKNTGTLTLTQVLENQETLKSGDNCLAWLLDRGLDAMAIDHYQIGACRTKIGDRFYPAISIPVPDGHGQYHNIKRPIPWVPKEEQPPSYKKWSQWGVKATIWVTHEAPATAEYWLVEGMWDAIALGWMVKNDESIADRVTVCTSTAGSGNVPDGWEIDQWMPVQCPIVVWYDLDAAGFSGAMKWKDKLGTRVVIADVGLGDEDKPDGYDVSDAIEGGVALAEFWIEAQTAIARVERAATYSQPAKNEKAENPLRAHLFKNDEYIAQAPDYIDWLVQDLLTPNELFVLGMPPRGGKSLLGLTLAKAIAGGTPFLDRPTTQGSVIYVNLEDGPTKVKIRQVQQDWAEGLPVYWLDRFKLSALTHLKELAQEIGDVRLVILDTLSRVRDDGLDESSSKLSQVLEPLQEWCAEAGICCLLVHHTGKISAESSPDADPFDKLLRGSSAIRSTCRGAIVITAGAESYRLIAENGYTDRLDLAVRLNPDTLEWRLVGNWTPRIDGDMKTQILDMLNHCGESNVADIARQLNFNASSVSTVMSRLHRDEMVSKRGGSGRIAATYTRSSNLLKQQSLQFEHPNPITASDTSLLKQKNIPLAIDAKSDQLAKSDHPMYQPDTKSAQTVSSCEQPLITFAPIDHFSPSALELFEQSSSPDGASVPCSNSEITSLSKIELGQKVTANRPGLLPRVRNSKVIAVNLPPVLDTAGRLSPGVMLRKGKEEVVVAESDCVRTFF